jgi:putative pyruvate formate lyase activating enzyme
LSGSPRAAYLDLLESGELDRRVGLALEELHDCRACPRDCGVDRLADAIGVCRSGRHSRVASCFPHFGEEDCLSGSNGSGTIFFAWCNLRCVFCQNHDISQQPAGEVARPMQIAEMALHLQDRGCHNINFVTPEHVVPQVIEAVAVAARRGLRLPIVYNTSAYDSLRSLELLDGIVDIYMPDFKLWSRDASRRLLLAPDYPEVARAAIREMHRQVGDLVLDEHGLAQRGVLVRHLVMPGLLNESREIFAWLAHELGTGTYLNLMGQYSPAGKVVAQPDKYNDIARRPAAGELEMAFGLAEAAGVRRFDKRQFRPARLGS